MGHFHAGDLAGVEAFLGSLQRSSAPVIKEGGVTLLIHLSIHPSAV